MGLRNHPAALIGAIMKTNDKSLVLLDVRRCSSAYVNRSIDQLPGEIAS